jgi:hypothetical protein
MNIIAQLDMVLVATQEANLKIAVRSVRFEVSQWSVNTSDADTIQTVYLYRVCVQTSFWSETTNSAGMSSLENPSTEIQVILKCMKSMLQNPSGMKGMHEIGKNRNVFWTSSK